MFSRDFRKSAWSYYCLCDDSTDNLWDLDIDKWVGKKHFYGQYSWDWRWNLAIWHIDNERREFADDLQKYNEKHLAFAMAFHWRLGSDSAIKRLGVPIETSGLIYKINM